jgi:hypothetical protein
MNPNLTVVDGRYLYDGEEFVLTVAELHAALEEYIKEGRGNDYIVTANDSEGNGFRVTSKGWVTPGLYFVEGRGLGSVFCGEEDEQIEDGGPSIKCVCVG